jgi:hypothetical protein
MSLERSAGLCGEHAQRFTDAFGDGGGTIAGRRERSPDGEAWELDFETTYTRRGA